MVALTGFEPAYRQFGRVQLRLSSCVFSPVGIPRWSETPPQTADVTAQSQRRVRRSGEGGLRSFGVSPLNCPQGERRFIRYPPGFKDTAFLSFSGEPAKPDLTLPKADFGDRQLPDGA
jgi:hypothetical protein